MANIFNYKKMAKPSNYLEAMKQQSRVWKAQPLNQPTQLTQQNQLNTIVAQPTQQQQQQPTTQTNVIQGFLSDSKNKPELETKRQAVIEMIQNKEDDSFIEDTIINKMQYKPEEQWFIGWAWEKTKEWFKWWIKRIWEAGEWLANKKYTMPEAFARWWAWALESFFSPLTWVIWEGIETWIEKIPDEIKQKVIEEATPTIEWVKEWYNNQSPEQQRQLDNIWVWVDLLLNFVWGKAIEQTWKQTLKQTWKTIWKTTWLWKQVITKSKDVTKPITKLKWKAWEFIWEQKQAIKTLVWKWEKTVETSQNKAFKALNPTINKLSKNRWLKSLQNKANRANEIIVEKWYIPKDTQTRADFHQKAMKDTWKQIENKIEWNKAKIDFKKVSKSIDDYLKENPALKEINPTDYKKLVELSKNYSKMGNKDVIFAENAKQILNWMVKNWGEWEKLSQVVSNWFKRATKNLWEQLDDVLSNIPWEFSKLKKDYWALAETLEDTIKANIVNLRKKGYWLTESYSRIEWLSDLSEWLFSIVGKPSDVVPKVTRWLAKLAVWKRLEQLRDPDILIKDAFETLSNLKPKTIKNVNKLPSVPNSSGINKNIKWTKKIKTPKTIKTPSKTTPKVIKKPSKITPQTTEKWIIQESKKGLKNIKKPTINKPKVIKKPLSKKLDKTETITNKDFINLEPDDFVLANWKVLKLKNFGWWLGGNKTWTWKDTKWNIIKHIKKENISRVLNKQDKYFKMDMTDDIKKLSSEINKLKNSKEFKAYDMNKWLRQKTSDEKVIKSIMDRAWYTDDMIKKWEKISLQIDDLRENFKIKENPRFKTTPKTIKKPTKAINTKAWFINPWEIQKDIAKLWKIINPKNITKITDKIVKQLDIVKSKIPEAKRIIKEYIVKHKDKLKDKLWDLFDDLADKLGARSKFIDDTWKSLDDFGDELIKKAKKSKNYNENVNKYIKQLNIAQEKSDLAKWWDYNLWELKRELDNIYDSWWQWRGADERIRYLEKEIRGIERSYNSKQTQVERAIMNSKRIWRKPVLSLDDSWVPVVYFETPKWQVSFHMPTYWPEDFNYFDNITELEKFLPQKLKWKLELVDDYKWSWKKDTANIIKSLKINDYQ